jgi:hypothetical protein
MPIIRFMIGVGTSLIALLFVVDRYLPQSLPEPARGPINRPVIRIASVQQSPERIVIDTSQPTIVPLPTLFTDAVLTQPSPPLQSYASAAPPSTVTNVDKKKRKVTSRLVPGLAPNQPPLVNTLAAASAGSASVPQTTLSFMDYISGVRRKLFNLN